MLCLVMSSQAVRYNGVPSLAVGPSQNVWKVHRMRCCLGYFPPQTLGWAMYLKKGGWACATIRGWHPCCDSHRYWEIPTLVRYCVNVWPKHALSTSPDNKEVLPWLIIHVSLFHHVNPVYNLKFKPLMPREKAIICFLRRRC